ncbi:nuclear transport factor 2 family protein [Amycolatopsis saalfeldensis]|uniref:Ketosteroid isomerase-related protein n=1 Tax=Amycolatopsis saalfeldensis TaxID=394193 RepID=A0A1H8YRM1_9PSEU|nr:nuclear transport factor 2 family protein [Amycolatopsis saalfeldensis]SEP54028.1 Ketosteroid isomerase-related protein [Amycolatopsis saalfeldensis]
MTTPIDLFHRLIEGLAEGRYDELSSLYAEDAVVEQPTAVPRPRRLEGRQAVHALFTGNIGATMRLVAHDVVVHETTDPEVIVAEYRNTVESFKTGRTTENANILVIRARGGLLAHTRDYHDYLKLAAVRGSIEPVIDAYAQAPAHVPGPVAPRPAELADRKSPLGVFQRLCFGVSDARWAELPDLYAEQTDVRHPFLPDAPVLKTRDDLRAHFASAGELGIRVQATDLVTYQSADPEVIIGEFGYEGELGGKPFRINNIFVVRVRDGLVVESRDYGDHLALAATAGRLPELFASLDDQPS